MGGQRSPSAFLSCSLRQEDAWFVDWIARICKAFEFTPTGTVGLYDAAPQPIWQHMRDGVQAADCMVIAATPRYAQQDVHDQRKTQRGVTEMIQVELGMAVMADRPVLAFVLEGTDVGAFLPQRTQYVELRPNDQDHLSTQLPIIANYFRSAFAMIQERWRKEARDDLLRFGGYVLAGIGAVTVIDAAFDPDNSA